MMGAILLTCGYLKCNDGTFDCSNGHMPDISHVMGHPPLNKLYAIMLTAYAFNKQACVRAYHDSLTGIASPCTNHVMLIYGLMGCIFGPCIGFWDVYYMPVHCFVVAFFTAGEVLYVLTATGVLNSCRDKFPLASQQASIDRLVTCRAITVVLGVITLGAKVTGADIGPYSSWIEWILFNLSFYIFAVLANIMPYNDTVVPEEDTKQE
jgi:hypothetical protein